MSDFSIDLAVQGRSLSTQDRSVWLARAPSPPFEADSWLLWFTNGEAEHTLRLSAWAADALQTLLEGAGETETRGVIVTQAQAVWRVAVTPPQEAAP